MLVWNTLAEPDNLLATITALRENAQPYRFWGLLDSCLAARVISETNIGDEVITKKTPRE
ncbi:MAG: hypothetical protein O2966_07790 [Proteobacteria bacterium]|nr:hypothetical protein [Pseudomonadota bacterium]